MRVRVEVISARVTKLMKFTIRIGLEVRIKDCATEKSVANQVKKQLMSDGDLTLGDEPCADDERNTQAQNT